MSTALPAPPFKDRRGWLIAFGIGEILIGCLILLLIVLIALVLRNVNTPATARPTDAHMMIIAAAMYAAIAVLFVCIGIGSIHARRWARIAMLIVGWTWLVMGAATTILMAVMVPRVLSATSSSASPAAVSAQRVGEIVMFVTLGLFFVVLPVIFIVFYSSKNVKLTCENATPGVTASKPVVVLIASAWFWVGVFGYLFVFMRPAFPLFGYVLHGWTVYVTAAAMEALTIWLAWNLYRQKEAAWNVAVAWLIFGWASTLATIARLGFAGMYRAMGYAEVEVKQIESFTKLGIVIGLAFGVAFFAFLLATRKHYRQPAVAS